MGNSSPGKKSATGRKSKSKPGAKATTRQKIQRAVQKEISTQALQDSELRYRRLFEAAQDGILILDAQTGAIEDVNPYLIDMLGYSRVEFLKKKLWEVGAFKDVDASKIAFKVLQDQRYVQYENLPLRTKDGRLIAVEFIGNVYLTGARKVIQCNVRDLTERRRAEAELQQSEEFFRLLMEGVKDYAIFMLYLNGRVASWNSGAQHLKGYRAEEIIGEHFSRFFPEADIRHGKPDLELAIALKEGYYREEGWRVRKDGSQFMADVTITALRDEAGKLRGFAKIARDITERKLAEETLARSEQNYRTLFEDIPVGLYRTAADGRILDANPAMVKMLGYKDRKALLEANIVKLYVDPIYDLKFKDEIQKREVVSNFEAEFKRPDGTTFWTEDHIQLIRNEEGKPLFYEGSMIDITERKQAEERNQRQLAHLAALHNIDQFISASFSLKITLTEILKHVKKELDVDATDVLLLNNTSLYLEYGAGLGFRTNAIEKASVRLGQGHAGLVALKRELVQIPNLKDQPGDMRLRSQLMDEDFVRYYGVPLVAKGIVKGVLEVYHRSPLQPDQEWLDFLNTLAGQTAIAIDNALLFENLERSNVDLTLAYDATIEGWSHAMDLRDKETEGHTLRVTEMTMELVSLFGIKDMDLTGIRRGALLHDIGKMGVPDAILLKPEPLTEDEWVLMKKHPALAFQMLSPIRYLQSALDIPYCHHEKWDGTGYPRGLKGLEIPLPARIFAVVDVWDAVTSDRPYRQAWSHEKAIEYIRSESGTHFDPEIVNVCLRSGVFDRKRPNQATTN